MAKYAIENGNTAAAKYFSIKLDKDINESSIRSIKASYHKKRKLGLEDLPRSPRGRPLMLGKYDEEVCSYIKILRKKGAVVNSRIVLSAARGIIEGHDRTLLPEHGGPYDLTKSWALSILKMLGMVRRKATKGVKRLPEDFEKIKSNFLQRIDNAKTAGNVLDELIINWDQTGVNFTPVSEWI